ncbi:MAG: DUF4443 domain-containing protein [Thermoprotei archaeon]|nr:DUF4443 domain-containing protein [Thermoprotei archaeon]
MNPLQLLTTLCKGKISIPKLITLLILLHEEGPIGRYRICRELLLPEGIVRGLLSRLTRSGLVLSIRAGSLLSPKGEKILNSLLSYLGLLSIKDLRDLSKISKARVNVVAHMRGVPTRDLGLCLEERDVAVRFGAKGAIFIMYRNERLEIPGVCDDLESYAPEVNSILITSFDLMEGDLLVTTFNDQEWILREAIIAVALKLKGHLSL